MLLRIMATCGLLLVAMQAHAQASATLTLASDDRYRGVSLSDSRPVLQLDLGVDDATGDYAGVFASNARLGGRDGLRWQLYGGRAGRWGDGASWDVGVRYSAFTEPAGDGSPEVYAGVAGRRLGAHVAYAWRYFGSAAGALYLSFDGGQPL
ncbi:MAG: TorF family putative porin, partial [Lysobacteraceae bacterium]